MKTRIIKGITKPKAQTFAPTIGPAYDLARSGSCDGCRFISTHHGRSDKLAWEIDLHGEGRLRYHPQIFCLWHKEHWVKAHGCDHYMPPDKKP